MKKVRARLTNPFISRAWAGANRFARALHANGILESVRLPCRVISIGNLQAGGAGKTPLTMKIAKDAIARGLQVCILTRGYGSRWEKSGGIIRPEERGVSPILCGDEAALIHERVPGAWIAVGADRVERFNAASEALSAEGKGVFDLVLLDDGLQHWRIERDLNIIAITDAKFGESIFREKFDVIREEDLLVLTKGESFPEGVIERSENRVQVKFDLVSPEKPEGRFWLVCGVGDPERALDHVRRAGYFVVREDFFQDHHAYTASEVERILLEAQEQSLRVLITGKDWVKWSGLGVSADRVTVLEPEILFREGEAIWNRLLWGE